MSASEKIKCAVYARVSTDKQGDSIENQVSQCQEYISRLGSLYDAENLLIYRDEAVSGYYTSVFHRAEMKQAIKDAREHKFKLLVFKEVSRVGRDKQENPAIIGMFEQYGVRVVAINDNYDSLNKDNITFDILSVLSEQESKKISARVSSARKQKARRGQWGGEPPIGYVVNAVTKKLEVDPVWKHIPKTIFDLYVYEGLGTFKIALCLNNQGYRSKNGSLWCRETVNQVLRNPAYIGNVVHGKRRNMLQREYEDDGRMSKRKIQIKTAKEEWNVVENAHEPLIDRAIFYKAQQILLSRGHKRMPNRAYHPLTGILFCGKCKEGMVCQKRSYNGKEYRYYICKTYHKYGRNCCDQANVNAGEIEDAVLTLIRTKLQNIPSEIFTIRVAIEKELGRLEEELKSAKSKIQKLTKDQMALFQQRELFTEEVYTQEMLAKKRQIHVANEESENLSRQIENLTKSVNQASTLRHLLEEFRELNIEEARLRIVLHELIKGIVYNDGHLEVSYHYGFGFGKISASCPLVF
ncbi:recombinase family protein [Cohnella panacarvi]|uniref:recombinase family protein n=1 Tax=Cohnella panacarvi TaxID=400776 RepID=UPI00047BDB39|nr:recombinase family protein [Cohnella panacarvi]